MITYRESLRMPADQLKPLVEQAINEYTDKDAADSAFSLLFQLHGIEWMLMGIGLAAIATELVRREDERLKGLGKAETEPADYDPCLDDASDVEDEPVNEVVAAEIAAPSEPEPEDDYLSVGRGGCW